MINISKIFVTFFYIGFSKVIPGTVGSLVALIFISIINLYLSKIIFYLIFVLVFLLSIYMIDYYQRSVNKKDPSEIIIDEFLGIYFIFLFLDNIKNINNFLLITLIFILFRFFDVLKPFPINYIDRKITSSLGVILDDILAAFYTILCIIIINEFI